MKFEIKRKWGKQENKYYEKKGFPNSIERWGNRNFAWGNFDHLMLLSC